MNKFSVLIVDDDEHKARQVEEAIVRAVSNDQVSVRVAHSVAAAGKIMREELIDLLVLDVELPMRDGEEAIRDGGIRLLHHVQDNRQLRPPAHIIGLTAYDGLIEKYGAEFGRDMWYVIKFDPSSDEWERMLERKLTWISSAREGSRQEKQGGGTTSAEKTGLASKIGLDAPLRVLHEAIVAVPAVRYALGIAGVVSVIAIVGALRIDLRVAAFGAVVMLALMIGLLLFSRAAGSSGDSLLAPMLVLVWVGVIVVTAASVLLLTAVFFRWPFDLQYLLRAKA